MSIFSKQRLLPRPKLKIYIQPGLLEPQMSHKQTRVVSKGQFEPELDADIRLLVSLHGFGYTISIPIDFD